MVLTQWETLCGLFFAFFEKIVVPILTSGGYVGLSLSVILPGRMLHLYFFANKQNVQNPL